MLGVADVLSTGLLTAVLACPLIVVVEIEWQGQPINSAEHGGIYQELSGDLMLVLKVMKCTAYAVLT